MNKTYAAWLVGINLALLMLLYAPLLTWHKDGYMILSLCFFNEVLIGLNLIIGLIVSLAPPWRKYASAWWLSAGVLLLASFPVCYGFYSFSSHAS